VNHTRYRRIIDAYRLRLMELSPAACDEVDDRVWSWGESWLVDDRPFDLDALMTAQDIAERFGLRAHNVRDWARRHPDQISKVRCGGRVLYRLREVMVFFG